MRVCAAPGLQGPKEGKPREYITDDPKGVDVPDTPYYRRLLNDGSLLEVPPETVTAAPVAAPATPGVATAPAPAAPAAVTAAPVVSAAPATAVPAAATASPDKKEGGDQ